MAKPKMVKSDLDQQIANLVAATDKKILVTWACDCAERVLPYFEEKRPDDQRPRRAIETGRTWMRDGVFRMGDIRGASLASHAAARDVESDDAARSAARAAGQAVATTHVPAHSIAAAIYAATAARDSVPASDAETAVTNERRWQYRHLIELREHAN
jgi:immunity protein 5 of polymorphic toxin system